MKKSRFSLFTPSLHMLVPSLATSLVLSTTTAYGAVNEMTAGNTFGTPGNWSIGTAPVGNANSGSHTDLLFTTPSTTINHGGTFVYARSYNATNGTSYIINSNRLVADAGATVFRVGSTAAASPPATFTNEVSGIDNDLVYLSNNSNLTFDGVNPVEGGLAPTLNLRLSTGNFNISEGSTLTIGMSLTGSATNIVVNGNGTTVLSGTNTYTGTTTVNGGTLEISGTHSGNGAITHNNGLLEISGTRSGTGTTTVKNGTLEISGTNAGINYTLAGTVNPSEPVLKLSNVDALPVTAIISGANSTALDGIVDLAVAGSYTMGSYNLGNITFTTTSGSPTTLTFTDASTVTTTANGGRTFNNGSPDLSILFSSTLDIGGDVVATINLNGSGNTTVTGGIISTGTNVRSLAKGGTGTLTLNGEGTYAGTTTLNAGVLRLGHANALPGGIAATGGTSNLVFNATTAVIGLTAASGDFLRTIGTGADQVTANPTEDPGLTRRMGFAAFGGNRVVDFGAPISLSAASLAGRGLTFGASTSDSKVTVVNDINLANSSRTILVNDGSAAVDAELSGVISHDGGTLSKTGAGTLALTGTNTYGSTSGGTEVLAGVLIVDGDSLSDTSKLVIDGGKVQSTGIETVDTLFFGLFQQEAGTWGSSDSIPEPEFIDDERFSGTGVVIVETGPGGGDDYTTWATSFGLENPWVTLGNPALNGETTADPDGDGVTNNDEYAFGLIPTSGASSNPITTQLDRASGKFSYTRRATPETTGLAYTVTTSIELVAWPIDEPATNLGQDVTSTVDGVETVEVTLTGAPLTAPKLFVRVQAE